MPSKDPNYMKEYMRKRRKNRRDKLISLLGGKCVDCGTTESLEFDHLDPKTKRFEIADAKDGPEDLLTEEAKLCALRCSKCHQKKTRDKWEFGSEPARHGTIWMYKKKCRCDDCKKAISDYMKKRRSLSKMISVACFFDDLLKKK